MKTTCIALLTPLMVCLVGCATAPRVTMLEQVGPGPALAAQHSSEGYLQVYSAREKALIDLTGEEFIWNNDFGWNEFLHAAAHTGYSIYAPDGHLLQRVRNTTGMNDANPTLVKLSPGVYRVEAEAEDYNDITLSVTVPVCIKPGLTTSVHLDDNWNPPAAMTKEGDQIVRLPNGNIVGWRLLIPDSVGNQSKANGLLGGQSG